jgi:hydrogenase expression/formation protein HypD
MDFIQDFRDTRIAKSLLAQIKAEVSPDRKYNLMEFCGGHTHALHRYVIPNLLPANIKMIHGPGCPVCVLPISRIDQAIYLSSQAGVIFCSYADMLRVPGSHQDSLIKAKARGADVRMVYSIEDALDIADKNPKNKIIFFAIGFETTTPPTVVAIDIAIKKGLKNFSIFCNHVLTPIAMEAILSEEVKIDGFLGPSHVSVVIGSDAYHEVTKKYNKPMVVAGFEPLDVLQSILMLVKMINNYKTGVENQYIRAVTPTGNVLAQQLVSKYLEVRESFEWRGLGFIPNSALKIKDEYSKLDAECIYTLPEVEGLEHKQCACPDILRGLKEPKDCKLFGVVCTPEQAMGACMVSSEGACAAHYQYGGL